MIGKTCQLLFSIIMGSITKFNEELSKDIEDILLEEEVQEKFYELVYKDEVVVDIKIKYLEFIRLLQSMGYYLFEETKPSIFVKIEDNVIHEVSLSEIQHSFLKYLKDKHQLPDDLTINIILEKFYKNPSHYFSDSRLSLLKNDKPIIFNRDSVNECFLYFKNGYVSSNSVCAVLKDYKDLQSGFIWKNQKIDRDFTLLNWTTDLLAEEALSVFGEYSRFLWNISGKDSERFFALCSIVGYLIHNYFHYKLKAVILTDGKITDKPDGRTGKTLFGKGLSHVRKVSEINGKDFDPSNKHKYQEGDIDTQIICLNDVRRNFDPENLFNDVTEGIKVERKNKQPYNLRVKMLVTANKTLNIEGASGKDRFIEFELSEHYSNTYSPKEEFGHWLFTEWCENEWNKFDNFMVFCVCFFLKRGLMEAKPINLVRRKLVDKTSMEFAEFMDNEFLSKRLMWSNEYEKKEIQKNFFMLYPEFEGNDRYKNLRNFSNFIKAYIESIGGIVKERRSNSVPKIEFLKVD